jgi:hypothetical protein
MWLGPVLYVAISIFLWQYAGTVFMPELLARRLFSVLPVLQDAEIAVVINIAVLYFAPYFVLAFMWQRARIHLRHPFAAAVLMWLMNVLVLYPLLGRGLLGYRIPQGWLSANLPLLISHWIFARGLQFQQGKIGSES